MAVKILMTWDILPGKEQEYFEFVVRDWIPGLQRMGMQPNDAWYTYYGDQPQILASVLMHDLEAVNRALDSEQWDDLSEQLLDYVENFDYKIVPAKSGFQL